MIEKWLQFHLPRASRALRYSGVGVLLLACTGGGYSLGRPDTPGASGDGAGETDGSAGKGAASGGLNGGGDGSGDATSQAGTGESANGGGANGGSTNGGRANGGTTNGGGAAGSALTAGRGNGGGSGNGGSGSASGSSGAGGSSGNGGNAGNGGSAGSGNAISPAALVSPAYDFECALSNQGQVKCWGKNEYGQLGQGDVIARGVKPNQMGANLTPVALGTGRSALQLVTGDQFACALLDNHSVKCWGRNQYGQLGTGDSQTRGDNAGEMGDDLQPIDLGTGRTALNIGAMSVDVCAVLDDHTVKCWGFDGGGELCVGTATPGGNSLAAGDEPGEMGDNLQRAMLGNKQAVSIAAGMYHACAHFSDDTIKCWGVNSPPVLGYGDTTERGNWTPNLGNSLAAVNLGKNRKVKSVASGVYHTCAILDDDSTKCWGGNFYGQLGLGDNKDRGGNAGEMGDALPVVDLGSGRHATRLALGNSFTCAVLDNGAVKCWGQNEFGQTGTGDATQRGDNPGEMGDALPAVNLGVGRTALDIGASRSGFDASAKTDLLGWKAWGDNEYGQLGLGKTSLDAGANPTDMGDNLPYLELGF